MLPSGSTPVGSEGAPEGCPIGSGRASLLASLQGDASSPAMRPAGNASLPHGDSTGAAGSPGSPPGGREAIPAGGLPADLGPQSRCALFLRFLLVGGLRLVIFRRLAIPWYAESERDAIHSSAFVVLCI